MRHIHSEAIGKDREHIASVSQMLQPLHLVIRVVHEPLIERRQKRRLLDHDIPSNQPAKQPLRLLRVPLKASHGRELRSVGCVVPLREVIVVQLIPRPERAAPPRAHALAQLSLGIGELRQNSTRNRAARQRTDRCTPGTRSTSPHGSRTRER